MSFPPDQEIRQESDPYQNQTRLGRLPRGQQGRSRESNCRCIKEISAIIAVAIVRQDFEIFTDGRRKHSAGNRIS